MLHNSDRIDIIWDVYRAESLKESTRERMGKDIQRKVSGQTNQPPIFQTFFVIQKTSKSFSIF